MLDPLLKIGLLLVMAAPLAAGCLIDIPDHPPARHLALRFEALDNHYDGAERFRAALTLTNNSTVALAATGWTLYFNFVRLIDPESVSAPVQVSHLNGDFFKLEPTAAFTSLQPGESLAIPFDAAAWAIKETDAPAGFYIVFTDADGQAGPPEVVADISVAPFLTRQQTDRMTGDNLLVPTPASRYTQNQILTPLDDLDRIVPTPVALRQGRGHVTLDPTFVIRYAAGLEQEAAYLAEALEPLLGTRLATTQGTETAATVIALNRGDVQVDGRARQAGDEAYRLTVDATDGIAITGTDGAGVLYGIQSLRAWLPVAAYQQAQDTLLIEEGTVTDAPRFVYRGLHLDVARNFQTKDAVLKLLDLMAFYKLNTFHFHLTDDEGWRLAIDALPELTDVGARRGHTLDEHDHLVPSLGSGPDPATPHGSGFYTRADFIEILRHAHRRHIEVIPEIDVPGHARAAIKAMEARHARLTAEDQDEQAAAFLLTDPNDLSTYQSVQMWNDNVIDVCLPSTYRFLETVVDALIEMYAEAGAPLTTLHTGGDEVPHGVWERSPACARLAQQDADENASADLSDYFLRRLSAILAERGLVTAGWEEVALKEETRSGRTVKVPNKAFVDHAFRPYVWNSVWGWGAEDVAYRLANAGYQVVLSNATNLYFDMAYDKDPKEPGYYWAAFVDTRSPYELVPFDLYKSAWQDRLGNPINPAVAFQNHVPLTRAGRDNILGIQGQLWAENAKGQAMMEYLIFPKLLGLAERAWAPQPAWALEANAAARKRRLDAAWNRFAHTLGHRELPRLDHLQGGVAYRLPLPGVVVEDGLLKANVAFPGLALRYTTDGSEPNTSSPLYTGPVPVSGPVRVKTFDTRGRSSRTAVVEG